uniref:Solute carrier family 22 member 21 n=1 Tax=Takifugu rubripes TaxID=31033 RepID=H2RVK8_TAKRU
MTDYDSATAFLGEWGRFQKQVFYLLCLRAIPCGYTALSVVFLAGSPHHHCLVPPQANLTPAWENSSIPLEERSGGGAPERSFCSRYKLTEVQRFSDRGLLPADVNWSTVATEGCLDGWQYDQSIYASTVVSEWDLVCDYKWKKPLTTSVFFCGVLSGAFICGQLADRYGRKLMVFVGMGIHAVSNFLLIFSPSWTFFCCMYFLVGLGNTFSYSSTFVLGSELLSPRLRKTFATLGVNLGFAVGYMMLPLLAFLIRDWRMLLVALALPNLLYIPFWWYIPESPRWLVSCGKIEEAEAIIRAAAKKNNVKPPTVIFTPLQKDIQSPPRSPPNICELVSSRNVCGISVTLWLLWPTVTITYLGVSLNTGNLHGNAFLNCFLSALVEIPAYFLSWVFFRWCSRRVTVFSTLCMAGMFLLIIQLIPSELIYVAIGLEMMAKFAVTVAFSIVYGYTVELYPTVLRTTALGSCSMMGKIGSIVAPYFIYLRSYSVSLPYILIGCLAVLLALLSLLLPESHGKPLPDLLDQMQSFPGLRLEAYLLHRKKHLIKLLIMFNYK